MKTNKKKSKKKTRRAAARDKYEISKGDVKKIKDLEGKIDFSKKEFGEIRISHDKQIKKMQREVKVLENPYLKKAEEMSEFMNSEFKEVIKNILADKRFKHLREHDFDFDFVPDRNGECIYINFEMDILVNEGKKVKLQKEEDDEEDGWDDDDDDE